MTTQRSLFERAQTVIPGGVNSPVRAFRSVGGDPYFVDRAEGGYVWDVEGTRYIDLVQSYGAVILGHAHPAVVEAVRRPPATARRTARPPTREVLLAEAICERVPSCERVRLVNSGTEATMTAVRLARGYTGRHKVVKFAGNYHGHGDALLAGRRQRRRHARAARLGRRPRPARSPRPSSCRTTWCPTLDDDVACVIVEPVAANMGLVPPAPGFLEGLRRASATARARCWSSTRSSPGSGSDPAARRRTTA